LGTTSRVIFREQRVLVEDGAWPLRALCGITRILNYILSLTGTQNREAKTGETRSLLAVPVRTLPAELFRHPDKVSLL